jgi:hypothetical protein
MVLKISSGLATVDLPSAGSAGQGWVSMGALLPLLTVALSVQITVLSGSATQPCPQMHWPLCDSFSLTQRMGSGPDLIMISTWICLFSLKVLFKIKFWKMQ